MTQPAAAPDTNLLVKSLDVTLGDLRGGAAKAEFAQELNMLVAAVRAAGKKGKITWTLTVQPATKAEDGNTLIIVDEVRATPPEPDRGATVMYATEDNRLSRRDPRQPALAFDEALDRQRGAAESNVSPIRPDGSQS